MSKDKQTSNKESSLILTSVPLNELTDIIRDCVRSEVDKKPPALTEDNPNELLTIKEAAKLLKKSKTTLNKWKKNGTIPSHRLASRVYFKKQELIEAMKSAPPRRRGQH